jgi:DNA-binding MarR family transcriptional regulator
MMRKRERQVRVRLTATGRRMLERIEKAVGPRLVDESGLGEDEFATVRKAVAGLRDNLLRSRPGER